MENMLGNTLGTHRELKGNIVGTNRELKGTGWEQIGNQGKWKKILLWEFHIGLHKSWYSFCTLQQHLGVVQGINNKWWVELMLLTVVLSWNLYYNQVHRLTANLPYRS
jgi:hypothetical protein